MTGPAEMRELAERLRKQLQQNRMTVYMDGSGYFNRYDVEAAEAALREAAERVGAMELQHDIDMSRMNSDWSRMLERAEAAERQVKNLTTCVKATELALQETMADVGPLVARAEAAEQRAERLEAHLRRALFNEGWEDADIERYVARAALAQEGQT